MIETEYTIDEVKLMTKVKRYKRRWKEQRHYSEYLKCKLAKKAMQVQKLKEQVKTLQAIKSGWNVLDDIESENTALRIRIAELGATVERLVETIESGAYIRVSPDPDINGIQKWYAKMESIIAEWKESKND
jgi:hypothetical protein